MSQFDQVPYFRDYVEQILRPRVGKLLEEVRSQLTETVWADLTARMARDQGAPTDMATMQKLRGMLEEGLRLRLTAHVVASFDGAGAPAGSAAQQNGHAGNGSAEVIDERENVSVVEGGFPNNPLARAVGGIRRAGR